MKKIIKYLLGNYTLEDIKIAIQEAEEYARIGDLKNLRKKMEFINLRYLLLKKQAGTCLDEKFGLAGRINNIFKISFP